MWLLSGACHGSGAVFSVSIRAMSAPKITEAMGGGTRSITKTVKLTIFLLARSK